MRAEKQETAILAAGCFWGVEELFRELPGVLKTEVGYTGGQTENPTYTTVKTGKTGHAEAIRIVFDSSEISYREIVTYFFRLHDPTTLNRQGNDVGTQYRSAIFFTSEAQKLVAHEIMQELDQAKKWPSKIATQIVPAETFYSAEEYHQKYLKKNPGGYTCHYLRD